MSVKIYTTSTCHFCKDVKAFFAKHGVKYTEIDVTNNVVARREAAKKSGQIGVPVIDVNGKIIIGYDESALSEALEL